MEPALSEAEGSALSGAEGSTASSEAEGPALSGVERPASIADGVERRLDPRVIDLERLIGWIVTAVVSAGLFLAGATTLIAARSMPWRFTGRTL